MTRVYLVRHGTTEWNKEEIFRGRFDCKLDDTGLAEARALEGYFREVTIDSIYSSPLSRATETAQAVSFPKGLMVIPDPSQEKVGQVLNRDEKKAAGKDGADGPAGYVLLHARPQVHPTCAAGPKESSQQPIRGHRQRGGYTQGEALEEDRASQRGDEGPH